MTISNIFSASRMQIRWENKALVPTAGAALSSVLSVIQTRLPISTPHPARAVGTA